MSSRSYEKGFWSDFNRGISILKRRGNLPDARTKAWVYAKHKIRRLLGLKKNTKHVNKTFRVVGHPRTGTGFMSDLFLSYGFKVRHEFMGKDGISSWMFAVPDAEEVPFTLDDTAPVNFSFDHTVHVLRNPIKAISSIHHVENREPKSLDFRGKYLDLEGLNPIELAARSYAGWNDLIAEQGPDLTVKLEMAGPVLGAWLADKGFLNEDWKVPEIPRSNTSSTPKFTLDEVISNINDDILGELEPYLKLYKLSY